MGSLAWWKLRRNPCFECGGEGLTIYYPWIDLLISVPVDALLSGWKGHYEVMNDPFSTSNEFKHVCPYCTSEDDLYDEYRDYDADA